MRREGVGIGVPPALRRFCVWVAALTLLSELYSAAMSHFFGVRAPYGGTLAWVDSGSDLRIFERLFAGFGTPRFWDSGGYPFTYPAPLAIVYWLLYRLPEPVPDYLALSVTILLGWAWYFSRRLAALGVSQGWALAALAGLLAMAWPVRFLLQTGNVETLVALALGWGVVAAMRGRWTLGAASIGVAGSMKIYPMVLLGLMLGQRRYRAFAAGVGAAVGVTVASLAICGPGVVEAQRHIDEGLVFLRQAYVLRPLPGALQFNHSLFNLATLAVVGLDRMRDPLTGAARAVREHALMEQTLNVYVPAVAALGVALYVLRLRRLPALNQAIALTVCAVLLPPYSLDYTLVQLLVPLGLVCVYTVAEWREGREPRGLGVCFGCFAVILTTGAFFELRYRFAAQVRTVALLVLLLAVCRYRFEDRVEDRVEAA